MISNNNYLFYPVNNKSKEIFKKKEFALIGVSPFNSFFDNQNIYTILKDVSQTFENYYVFIPNKISSYTLKALGYDDQRIHHKVRKQDNYLKNKTLKVLDQLNNFQVNRIILLSDLVNNDEYNKSYNQCLKLYNENSFFKKGCIETSSWVLSAHEYKRNIIINEEMKEIAVQYFLKELPLFLNSSKILNVKSCMFIYHNIPQFLKVIYNNYDLANQNQGFAIIKKKVA